MADTYKESESLLGTTSQSLPDPRLSQIRRKPVGGGVFSESKIAAQGRENDTTPPLTVQVDECPTSSNPSKSPSLRPATTALPLLSSLRWWYFEVISLTLAIACLAAIFGILLVYDGRRQDSWMSDILTLNGCIALLATSCRTLSMVAVAAGVAQGKWISLSARDDPAETRGLSLFALFEDAAKGPWGSSKLIWRLRGMRFASLGAAITILSLAYGVVTQQLISLRTEVVETLSSGPAGEVPRASYLTQGVDVLDDFHLVPAERMAIYNGFMAQSVEPVQVTCPTAQCTWPIIPTLAVCGACINTTESIRIEQQGNSPNCTATSSTGQQLSGPCVPKDINSATDILFHSSNVSTSNGVLFNGTTTGIVNFGGIKAGRNASWLGGRLEGSQSTECALWYCIEAHNISISRGKLRDEVIDTWQKRYNKWNKRIDFEFTDMPEYFNLHPEEFFGSDGSLKTLTRRYFNQTVEGVIRGTFWHYTGQGGSRVTGGDFIWSFFHYFDDADAWISRLARSMTNQIRLTGKVGGLNELDEAAAARVKEKYEGTAFAEEVVIRVRWGWITYPVGLSVLSIVFLVAQILSTARRPDVRAWKDEPLATLWLDVDANMKEEMRKSMDNPGGLRTAVGEREVQISRDDNTGFPTGFHFKTQ